MEGSYTWVSTVLGASVLVSIRTNEAISAGKFLKVEGSYTWVSTVLGASVFVLIILNEEISACIFFHSGSFFLYAGFNCKPRIKSNISCSFLEDYGRNKTCNIWFTRKS